MSGRAHHDAEDVRAFLAGEQSVPGGGGFLCREKDRGNAVVTVAGELGSGAHAVLPLHAGLSGGCGSGEQKASGDGRKNDAGHGFPFGWVGGRRNGRANHDPEGPRRLDDVASDTAKDTAGD